MKEKKLIALKGTIEKELDKILNYWSAFAVDAENLGFYGEIANNNQPVSASVKGAVLNARILWTYAAAFNFDKKQKYLRLAGRAFRYISDFFIDREYGGCYWSVSSTGVPLDSKKQIYAIAFMIYGLSEYYKASKNEYALELAKSLYTDIERHSYDKVRRGYFEAFTRTWETIADLRLSKKDANEKKTMNTHLHILEAYTTLYQIWPDTGLQQQIRSLINVFENYIIDHRTGYCTLFFDENWYRKSYTISYGHDIEASWLLTRAAEVLGDKATILRINDLAIKMANAAIKGMNEDGSMNYEFEPLKNILNTERHWWVQAEAMVGFFNAYCITKDENFYELTLADWQFIQKNIIDHEHGEWHWGVLADGSLMAEHGKGGFWKCPYHNSRVCMEMINRINKLIKIHQV
jgi:mannobiose 2-epimerase